MVLPYAVQAVYLGCLGLFRLFIPAVRVVYYCSGCVFRPSAAVIAPLSLRPGAVLYLLSLLGSNIRCYTRLTLTIVVGSVIRVRALWLECVLCVWGACCVLRAACCVLLLCPAPLGVARPALLCLALRCPGLLRSARLWLIAACRSISADDSASRRADTWVRVLGRACRPWAACRQRLHVCNIVCKVLWVALWGV